MLSEVSQDPVALRPDDIRGWLRQIDKPQRWLAEQLHLSPGHIRNILCGHDHLTARTARDVAALMERFPAQ